MTSFSFEGHILIDDINFGNLKVDQMKFIGINRLYDGNSLSQPFTYNETATGIIGLAPSQSGEKLDRNFLYQLKEKGVIDYYSFAISMDKYPHIQFGSYDPLNILPGHDLHTIKTVNGTSWAVQGYDFKIGDYTSEGLPSFLDETRYIYFEPSSPFIYLPAADFVKFARELQQSYMDQGIRCTYDNVKPSLSSSCRFEKPCSEVHSTDDDLFLVTIFDESSNEITLKLEGKDMFVSGKEIDDSDPTIADFCFVPFLKHERGPKDTWYLGTPILQDYYTVFDME